MNWLEEKIVNQKKKVDKCQREYNKALVLLNEEKQKLMDLQTMSSSQTKMDL